MKYWTRYIWSYPKVLLYMMQNTEFKLGEYIKWFHRTTDFRTVMKRRQLEVTRKIQLILIGLRIGGFVLFAGIVALVYIAATEQSWLFGAAAAIVALLAPYILAYGALIILGIGYVLIQKPKEHRIIARARKQLAGFNGVRIAIAGSYGKTTAKEMLLTVLSEGKNVKATPGNMNTAIGISRFIRKIDGDEDVLIFELGEERVGDVAKLADLTRPYIGVITGINEAHLSSFKSLDHTIKTIYELSDYVQPERLYQAFDNQVVREANRPGIAFSKNGVGNFKVKDIKTDLEGTRFTLTDGDTTVHAQTQLLGEHTVGITAAVIDIALRVGLTPTQIEAGLKKVVPFEHRMEPRQLHGAWIIDDTYNGNSDGIEAGLAFLKHQDAIRRIYITPGLVEQGDRTEPVHIKIGETIAQSNVDVTVFMQNSVTAYIQQGLEHGNYQGKVVIVDTPLDFYTNLDQFVAAGDVVLMQNDWTDNYS